jgi:hypothetical protein
MQHPGAKEPVSMPISPADRDCLRRLAAAIAQIAQHPANAEHDRAWRALNARRPGARPLVWINEIPWDEMNVADELTLRCSDPGCRGIEDQFRKTIYQWRHLRGHMIVESVYYCPMAIHDTGFGICQLGHNNPTGMTGGIISQEFEPQIKTLADVEKIRRPEIRVDQAASAELLAQAHDLFDGILTVRQRGVAHQWFTLWDNLIRWYGVQEALLDFSLNPELVHAALARLLDAFLYRLEQYERLGLLSPTNGALRVGSGGYACSDEVPENDGPPGSVTPGQQWGCANAQMLSGVSPEMHEEFSLRYDREWLQRFRLTYYGCCEALDSKMDILATVPNLRKISMSPWAKVERMVERGGAKYVLSFKPNPAVFADPDHWHPGWARRELDTVLAQARGCWVEIIMKDISTVAGKPERLWEWAAVAAAAAEAAG